MPFFCSKGLILCRFQAVFYERCSTLSSEEPNFSVVVPRVGFYIVRIGSQIGQVDVK